MTIQEISKLPLGTKVYKIWNGEIHSFQTLAFDAKDSNYFYLISGNNHTDAQGYYLPTSGGIWESDYVKAKEIMWQQIIDQVESKNRIYFEGTKDVDFREVKEKYELGDLKFEPENASSEFVDGINYVLDKLKK
jgi:hypothetical protein